MACDDETRRQVPRSSHRRGAGSTLILLALALSACGKSGGQITSGGSSTPGTGGGDPPQDLSYSQRVFVLSPGETIHPLTPSVTGTVSEFSIVGSLPAGIDFDTTTGVISGTAEELTEPSVVQVSAINADGSDVTSLSFSIPQISNFAFGVDAPNGSIVSFEVDRSCGSLIQVQSVFASTTPLSAPQIDSDGLILCVVDQLQLLSFGVDPKAGTMTPATSLELGVGPHDLYLHPSGEFVYVVTRSTNSLRAFDVDPATGAVDPNPLATLSTDSLPTRIIGDPHGRYLIVEHEYDDTPGEDYTPLVSYLLDSETGLPTQSATFSLVLVDPRQMVIDPLGEGLYLTTSSPADYVNWVIHYSIDPATGKPQLVDLEKAGQTPNALVIDPRGQRMYVANQASSDITLMEIDPASGTLDKVATLPGSSGVNSLSMSAEGDELYVLDPDALAVTIQGISPANGEFLYTQLIRTGASSERLAILSRGGAGVPTATNLYLLSAATDEIQNLAISPETGTLDLVGMPAAVEGTPTCFAVRPDGRFLYASVIDRSVPAPNNQVHIFGVECNGELNDLEIPLDLLAGEPGAMAIEPSGQRMYVAVGLFNLLMVYTIDSEGALSVSGSRPLGPNLVGLEVDPGGSFLALGHTQSSEEDPDRVVIHLVDPETGLLSPGISSAMPLHPTAMAFDPTGTRLYVTMKDDDLASIDLVKVFDVGPDGSLTSAGNDAFTQPEPGDIELTPDGKFALVTFEVSQVSQKGEASGGGLLVYHVDPDSGELSNGSGLPQWRQSVAAGEGPTRLGLTPDGLNAFVLAPSEEQGMSTVTAFDIDPLTGFPLPIDTELVVDTPVDMTPRTTRQ